MYGHSEPGDAATRRFWLAHAVIPAVAFAAGLAVILLSGADLRIADALFFDREAGRFIGAGSWWAKDLIHSGGRRLVQAGAVVSLALLVATIVKPRWRHLRRTAAFLALSLVLVPALVGSLKQVTRVDCPWNLQHYGGSEPYVGLLGDRSGVSDRARCFPGSHASSAFAWLCVYFLLRERRRRWAYVALAAALLFGGVFSFGQQARGAHFLSHDLTSLAIAWFMVLGFYRLLLMPTPLRDARPAAAGTTGVRWAGADGGRD